MATKSNGGNGKSQNVFFKGSRELLKGKPLMVFAKDFWDRFGPDAQAFMRMHKIRQPDRILLVEPVSDGVFAVYV